MKKEELDRWHHILLVAIRELAKSIENRRCKGKYFLLIDCKAIETRIEDIIEILDKEGTDE